MTRKLICPSCLGKGHLGGEEENFDGYVYFLFAPRAQRIKIGFTKNVDSRIKALQTASSEPLDLLVVTRGSKAHEKLYHVVFTERRDHGEWFIADERLLAAVKNFRVLEKISLAKILSLGQELYGRGNSE